MSGRILLSKLENLEKNLRAQKDKWVTVSLVFSVDQDNYCCIKGEMSVDIDMQCQRCLQPVLVPLTSAICVSPVVSDVQAKQLPAQYEPLLITDGEIVTAEWIAEELHLALPLVACHDTKCVSW